MLVEYRSPEVGTPGGDRRTMPFVTEDAGFARMMGTCSPEIPAAEPVQLC